VGFNRRYIDIKSTMNALNSNRLKEYYGKADVLMFDDHESTKVYHMFCEGKSNDEIINFIKSNLKNEKTI
jgi:NCAIR mutase (PurE)-related protein